MAKNVGKNIQTLILVLMIVGFPLISWYYLQSGYSYHKGVLDELRDYSELPDFNLIDQDGRSFVRDSLKGRIAIAAFFNSADVKSATLFEFCQQLHEQFDDREKVLILLHDLNPNAELPVMKSLAKQYGIYDINQVYMLTGTSSIVPSLLWTNYKIPNLEAGKNDQGEWTFKEGAVNLNELPEFLALIGSDAIVKNYFDLNDGESRKRLVEQVALTMPREKTEKPKLRRSIEK